MKRSNPAKYTPNPHTPSFRPNFTKRRFHKINGQPKGSLPKKQTWGGEVLGHFVPCRGLIRLERLSWSSTSSVAFIATRIASISLFLYRRGHAWFSYIYSHLRPDIFKWIDFAKRYREPCPFTIHRLKANQLSNLRASVWKKNLTSGKTNCTTSFIR